MKILLKLMKYLIIWSLMLIKIWMKKIHDKTSGLNNLIDFINYLNLLKYYYFLFT